MSTDPRREQGDDLMSDSGSEGEEPESEREAELDALDEDER